MNGHCKVCIFKKNIFSNKFVHFVIYLECVTHTCTFLLFDYTRKAYNFMSHLGWGVMTLLYRKPAGWPHSERISCYSVSNETELQDGRLDLLWTTSSVTLSYAMTSRSNGSAKMDVRTFSVALSAGVVCSMLGEWDNVSSEIPINLYFM